MDKDFSCILQYVTAYFWVTCWTLSHTISDIDVLSTKIFLKTFEEKHIYLIRSVSINIEKIEFCENEGT